MTWFPEARSVALLMLLAMLFASVPCCPGIGADRAGAQPSDQELMRTMDRVKRLTSEVESILKQGAMMDKMDPSAREKAMKMLSESESALEEIRRLLQQP